MKTQEGYSSYGAFPSSVKHILTDLLLEQADYKPKSA